jgi:ABC-type transport system substrate-binding protein
MIKKLLSSNTLHAAIIVFVMVAASFVLLVQTDVVSAQVSDTQLVVGLQNPATSLNFFDVATNSVWKAYMLEYNFESLYTYDPASALYSDLANNTAATNCASHGTGWVAAPYTGMCVDATGLNYTVQLHTGVTFADPTQSTPKPMTADDVVFTYQTLAWSTNAQVIYPALWWPQPMVPLWNSTTYGGTCAPGGLLYGCMSHIAVKKISTYEVGFQLLPVVVGGTKGAYALFFYATMVVPIIPMYIWTAHMNPNAQVNWSSPGGAVVSDTFDRSIDMRYSAIPATVGTGPFYLANYVQNSETTINVFTSYWGKGLSHTWPVGGTAYGFYPAYITSVKFLIFTSLDVVSLALQQGSIDTLVWSLTPGFYSQVQANPAITVTSVTDSGFFYLSFNMRRQPWDDLCLRKAISKAIDKTYIVNTLMGGFGVAGNVPISIVNPSYVNATAAAAAITFDPTGIGPTLEACGYTRDASTGFYKAPASEGGQIVSATILTPPKDYDPVRADAGIMISKNLKAAGVNINSAPTSFDTIVARGLTYGQVDYDIYVLGWSLGIFPETYICSFFCTNQDVQTNVAGSNSAGYANAQVDSLINQLTYTVDTTQRVKLMQDVEGIVTAAIPWNVLYYRKNLNAYRNDKFQGWQDNPVLNALSAGGGPFNFYTLVNLQPAGKVTPPPPTGALTLAATVPQRVLANHVEAIPVYVSQNGAPVSGATVTASSALPSGVALSSASGTTDMTGTALVNWTVPVIQGDLFLTVNAVKGTATASSTKQLEVTVGPPAPMALLSLSTPTPVISPTQTAAVTATLVDGQGAPIAGATVDIDPTLIVGTMSANSAVTDASGHAVFTYTPAARSLYLNAHQIDTIRANVTVPSTIVADTQRATLSIFVQNDAAPAWTQITVQGTPQLVLGPITGNVTTIVVKATDYTGAANTTGVSVEAVLAAGEHNVTISPATATTDANGLATFTVTNNATWTSNMSQNVLVRFATVGVVASTSDQVALLLSDNVAPGYAARMSFNNKTLPFGTPASKSIVTATVVNETNVSVVGAPVAFQIGYGDLGIPAEFNWSFDYTNWVYGHDGLALDALGGGSVGGSFQNSSAVNDIYGVENLLLDTEVLGPGSAGLDSCAPFSGWDGSYVVNATSVTNAAGQVSSEFTALPMPKDNGFQVIAYVGAPNQTLAAAVNTCSPLTAFRGAAFHIDSGVVAQRAPGFALGSVSTSSTVFTSLSRTMTITGTFYKLDGVPAGGVQVFAVRGQGSAGRNVKGTYGGTITTATNGTVSFSNTVPYLGSSQAYYYSLLPADPNFAFGGREQLYGDPNALGDYWIAPTFTVLIAKFPYQFQRGYLFVPTTVDFATATPASPLVAAGGTTAVTVSVFNGASPAAPVANATVWSGSFQALTDASGQATFNYAGGLGASEGWVYVTTADGQVMRAWFGVMALSPILSYGSITPSVAAVGSDSSFTVTVTNLIQVAGTATVVLLVDNTTVAAQQVSLTPGGNAVVTFHHVFTSTGNHVVTIGTANYTASVSAAAPSGFDPGTAYALAIGLLVVGIVVGVLIGMMLSRRRKQPTMAMPEETESHTVTESRTVSKPAEEEIPPEDKL